MLAGFIDSASRAFIVGWAADTSRPNEALELSVTVSGTELGRFVADRPRADLQALGIYGDGRHGFRFHFDPPLSESQPHEVIVRFARSQEVLRGGIVRIEVDQVDRADGLPSAPPVASRRRNTDRIGVLPNPTTVRELIEVLQIYDEGRKPRSFVNRIDAARSNLRQNYRAVLDRLPTLEELRADIAKLPPHEGFHALLVSEEFQTGLISLVLEGFAEKRRLIFVHVPKCAGTDLTESLAPYYPHLFHHLTLTRFTTKELLFSKLREISLRLRLSDSILITGHIPLKWYLEQKLIRFGDKVFTTIRDPMTLLISNANFIATRLIQFRKQVRADTSGWMTTLGIGSIPDEPSADYILALAKIILHNTSVTTPNPLCTFLGANNAASAVAQLIVADVEITDTTRYNAWREKRWGLKHSLGANESMKIITPDKLDAKDRDHIQLLTQEDQKLYDLLMRRLNDRSSLSIQGSELPF